jgi:hypothetical protein
MALTLIGSQGLMSPPNDSLPLPHLRYLSLAGSPPGALGYQPCLVWIAIAYINITLWKQWMS